MSGFSSSYVVPAGMPARNRPPTRVQHTSPMYVSGLTAPVPTRAPGEAAARAEYVYLHLPVAVRSAIHLRLVVVGPGGDGVR